MKLTKKTLLVSLAVALPVVLGGGYFLAKTVVWPRYKQYRAARFERNAREFLDKGDYENAMLFVRKNLATNPRSIPDWRLAVTIAEKRNDPSILYFYLQRLADLEPTLENRLRLVRLALKVGDIQTATGSIAKAGAEARDSAEFHELAAQVSLRAGNAIQAKFHLMALCELRPDNRAARLDLAQLRLAESTGDARENLRSEIRTLSGDPELRIRALVSLLADTIRAGISREAPELLTLLRREPTLSVQQAITVAEATRTFEPSALPAELERLRTLAGTKPEDILAVGHYLISAGRAAEAKTWLGTFAPPVTTATSFQYVQAEALLALQEWEPMEAFLKKTEWKDYDFERNALIAFAQRARGDLPAFTETWRLALANAGSNSARLNHLLQRTILWNWPEQRFEVLWRLFQQNPLDQAVQNALFTRARAEGDTANLNRLFGRLVEASPGNPSAKNNFAYTSLLLGANIPRALTLAQEVHASEPKNPFFATTHALALLRSGKVDQARAVLAAFDSYQLWQTDRAIVLAAVYLADGATDEAAQVVANIDPRGLLPEEKRILDDTRAALDRHRAETARTSQIEQTVAARRDATSARSVLNLLPETLRAQPTLAMELADSLYARDEFAALAKELDGAKWENRDFLRLALLAYAQRKLDRLADSRANWRFAVNSVSTRPELQRALADLARTWSWEEERIDLLTRVLQREPADQAALDEVSEYYLRLRRTTDLARAYGATLGAPGTSAANRARFAYYSLLTGSNTSEAHVAAKAAFDQNPSDRFVIRAMALSLWRQGQARAGLQILGDSANRDTAPGDLALILALLREAAGEPDAARKLLAAFPAATALPEETALADDLAKRLAKSN